MPRFTITAKPNKKESSVTQHGDQLFVCIDAPPTEGKANERLIALLANHFHVAPSNILLQRGHRGRKKIVDILF